MTHSSSSGNALWLVLITIVLLGALTALFARTSSNTDDVGDVEQRTVMISEMMRYTKSIEIGIQNLLSRGCSESDLSFWFDSNGDGVENGSDDYYNASAPPDGSCHLFKSAGAGLTWLPPKSIWFTPTGHKRDYITSAQCIPGIGTGVTPCTNADRDLMFQFISITDALCMAINNQVGITNPSNAPPSEDQDGARFTGSFTASGSTISATYLSGKPTGCFKDSAGTFSGQNVFYHVVLPR